MAGTSMLLCLIVFCVLICMTHSFVIRLHVVENPRTIEEMGKHFTGALLWNLFFLKKVSYFKLYWNWKIKEYTVHNEVYNTQFPKMIYKSEIKSLRIYNRLCTSNLKIQGFLIYLHMYKIIYSSGIIT